MGVVMLGDGYYNEHAAAQAGMARSGLEPLRRAAAEVAFFRAAFHSSVQPPEEFYPALLERVRANPQQARSDWWVFAFRLRRR